MSDDVERLEDVDGEGDVDDEVPLTAEERVDQLEADVDELKSEQSQLAVRLVICEGRAPAGLDGRVIGLEGVVDQLRRAIATAAPDAWADVSAKPPAPPSA